MQRDNLGLGYLGEKIAKEYLEKRGYKIVEQNCRNRYGEIDLVAKDRNEDCLVFVEVKTRTGEQFGLPEQALNRNKMFRLIRNAQAYIARKNYDTSYRIDALCIVLDKDNQVKRAEHYKNITNQ